METNRWYTDRGSAHVCKIMLLGVLSITVSPGFNLLRNHPMDSSDSWGTRHIARGRTCWESRHLLRGLQLSKVDPAKPRILVTQTIRDASSPPGRADRTKNVASDKKVGCGRAMRIRNGCVYGAAIGRYFPTGCPDETSSGTFAVLLPLPTSLCRDHNNQVFRSRPLYHPPKVRHVLRPPPNPHNSLHKVVGRQLPHPTWIRATAILTSTV